MKTLLVQDKSLSSLEMHSFVAKGAFLTGITQGSRCLLQILNIIVLPHFISPYQYGVFAIAMILINTSEIIRDFGLSSAAIQSKDLSFKQISNLFWCNLAIGFFLFALTCIISIPFEHLYAIPGLHLVVSYIGVLFIMNGAATQYRAYLIRHFKYTELTVSDVGGQMFGLAIALVFSIIHPSIWSLVVQQICQSCFNLISLLFFCRWSPLRFEMSVSIHKIIRSGWKITLTEIFSFISKNFAQFYLSIKYGPIILAIYNRAFQLVAVPVNQLCDPAYNIALPILSRFQTDDKAFNHFLVQSQIVLGHLIFASYFFLFIHSYSIIDLLLGHRWVGSSRIVKILSLANIIHSFTYPSHWSFISKNLLKEYLKYSLLSRLVHVVCVLIGSQFSVCGCACGYFFGMLLQWLGSFIWAAKETNFPYGYIISNYARLILLYSFCAFFSYLFSIPFHASLNRLLAGSIGMIISFLFFYLFSNSLRKDIHQFFIFFKSFRTECTND